MRVALLMVVVAVGLGIGLSAMEAVERMQQQRQDSWCKVDPSYCK